MFARVTDDTLKLSLYQLNRFLKMAKMLYTSGVLGGCLYPMGRFRFLKIAKMLYTIWTFNSEHDFYMVEFAMLYLVMSTQTAKMTDNIFETNTPVSTLKVDAYRSIYMRSIRVILKFAAL